jgi:hypothetical protein
MSILDGFFGSRRDVVWERLADEIGGSFFEGGLSPGVHLHARHDDGWFSNEFPNGMHELSLESRGEITDLARLEELYELFVETLHQLCRIGAAADKDPGIVI